MAKYIDLPNLKENLTNFLNKKINPIYAKKTEIPSNVSELNNDKSYQTAEEVGQAVTNGVAKIVAGAPEDFDTLKEMSDWISSHETSAAAMNSAISDNSVAIANHTSNSDIHVTKAEKTKWDNKVDSIEGKTLSNNNFLYKYKDTLDKMPTTYQYKTHYNKEDGTFNMVSINAGSQGTDPQTFQKYTLPSNYKDIFDGVNSKIEDLALNGVYSNKANIDEVNSNLSDLKISDVAGGKNLWCLDSSYTTTANESAIDRGKLSLKAGTYRLSYDATTSLEFVFYTDKFNESTAVHANANNAFTLSKDTKYVYLWINTGTVSNIQIEEGTTATEYEPYIPSVKMLAEENAQQSIEAMDLNMLGWSVPKECPVQNYVDSDGVFHQRVGRICLYDCDYNIAGEASNSFYTSLEVNNLRLNGELYCNKYKTVSYSDFIDNDKVICVRQYIFIIRDTSCSDITSFKNANKGVYLYYELATEKTISVDGNEAVTKVNESLAVIGRCKNLLNPTLQTTTQGGVTCTNNGDGTYTLNGTNQNSIVIYIGIGEVEIPNKNLVILGSKNTNVGVYIQGITPTAYGNKITVVDSDKGVKRVFGLAIKQGATITNEIVKPMLCENLNATYDDFVPYTGDGETLTADIAELKNDLSDLKDGTTPQDVETTTLTTTSGTATLYKLGKMRHLVLNDATFSSTAVLTSTDASIGTLYFRAEVLFNSGDDLEGGSASFEDICIGGSNMWNATRTATGASPVAVKGATGSATWMV